MTHPKRVTNGWSPEAKVAYYSDPPNEKGCRIWRGNVRPNGYGSIVIGGRTITAHRLSWEIANGPIPAGMCVCHRCDVRQCIEPDHLFLGTHADNVADMDRKGRRAPPPDCRGERCGTSKLTADQVLAIRAMSDTHVRIGAQFGVSQALVTMIKNRQRWAHLSEVGERA